MRRILALALLLAWPASAQYMRNVTTETVNVDGSSSSSVPATCTTAGMVPVFLGSPLALGCDARLSVKATSSGLEFFGTVQTLGSFKTQAVVYGTNLIPTMTGNTSPSGSVTCDRQCEEGWKAFDGNDGTAWNQMSPPYNAPAWIAYQFATATVVDSYSFRNDQAVYLPYTWTFSGSNDGSDWTVLDTRTAVGGLRANTTYTYSFTNSTAFTHYMLYASLNQQNNPSSGSLKIATLAFYSSAGSRVDKVTADATGVTSPALKLTNIPVYADNTAAASLAVGTVYRTSTGVLMVRY